MKTCLIVDESNVIRKVASRIIFKLDFTVENASTGAEALAMLRDGALPDLIIVAATLPDMVGDDLVRTLRARPEGSQPIILGSFVEANLGQMTRMKRAGTNGFIYKPFDRAALTGWLQPFLTEVAA
ncbi:MAG: response regulator [Rhizobiaceae bacterium]|nr:response regulator [Rhizobiaceae bacterium]